MTGVSGLDPTEHPPETPADQRPRVSGAGMAPVVAVLLLCLWQVHLLGGG
jgi:hypothetical protein